MSSLSSYRRLLEFLGNFLGTNTEVILYDPGKMEVAFIHNSFDSKMRIGSPIPDIEKRFIEQKLYEKQDSVINYRAFSVERKKLRSATHFLKDANDVLIGIITINYKVDELIELRNVINQLISGSGDISHKQPDFYESFNNSFEDLMNITIQEVVSQSKISPERLSQEEKIELVRTLDSKGLFLLKGSVTELAKVLGSSETTIYRYINMLKND